MGTTGRRAATGRADRAGGAGDREDELADLLVQLSFIVQTALSRLADRLDLSPTSMRMLAVLEDRRIGMQQLASILELEKSSVTGLVDRAERRGLVHRTPVPDNRRAVHVTTTAAGRELVARGRAQVHAAVAQLAEDLSPTAQARLLRSLQTMIDGYVRRNGIPV